MSHFAQIKNGIVENIIVAEQDFINTLENPSEWIQTSYNTRAGQHPEGRPLRKNYALIGGTYDAVRDAFIPPKRYPSWLLNEETCQWEAPVSYPTDGKFYAWDEPTLNWKVVNREDII